MLLKNILKTFTYGLLAIAPPALAAPVPATVTIELAMGDLASAERSIMHVLAGSCALSFRRTAAGDSQKFQACVETADATAVTLRLEFETSLKGVLSQATSSFATQRGSVVSFGKLQGGDKLQVTVR
jgi:hypothetical protein